MSTIKLHIESTSATKAQKEAAAFLFGKTAPAIVDTLEKLAKSKIVLSPAVRGLLIMLRDAEDEEIMKFKTSVSGKGTIKAVQLLAKAKTIDAGIAALKAIKVAKPWLVAGGKVVRTKPIPKVLAKKESQIKINTVTGAPQLTDSKLDPESRIGKRVNDTVRCIGNAGYPVNDTDVSMTMAKDAYQIRIYPKDTGNPREDIAYAILVKSEGTFSYGTYNIFGKGVTNGTEKNYKQAVANLIALVESENKTNANAFKVPVGKPTEKEDHRSEIELIDDLADKRPNQLEGKMKNYAAHMKAVGDNLKRNISGVTYEPELEALHLKFAGEEFATLHFTGKRWTLVPDARGSKAIDIGEDLDISFVIQNIKDLLEQARNKRTKISEVGSVNARLLRAKEALTTALASSSLKLFDDIPVLKESNDSNIVWQSLYSIPSSKVKLPIKLRYSPQGGYAFALNGGDWRTSGSGTFHIINKFINILCATVVNTISGASRSFVLMDGRPLIEGTSPIYTSNNVEIRCSDRSIFLTGNPSALETLYKSRFETAVDNNKTKDKVFLSKQAPNNWHIVCDMTYTRNLVLQEAGFIRPI